MSCATYIHGEWLRQKPFSAAVQNPTMMESSEAALHNIQGRGRPQARPLNLKMSSSFLPTNTQQLASAMKATTMSEIGETSSSSPVSASTPLAVITGATVSSPPNVTLTTEYDTTPTGQGSEKELVNVPTPSDSVTWNENTGLIYASFNQVVAELDDLDMPDTIVEPIIPTQTMKRIIYGSPEEQEAIIKGDNETLARIMGASLAAEEEINFLKGDNGEYNTSDMKGDNNQEHIKNVKGRNIENEIEGLFTEKAKKEQCYIPVQRLSKEIIRAHQPLQQIAVNRPVLKSRGCGRH